MNLGKAGTKRRILNQLAIMIASNQNLLAVQLKKNFNRIAHIHEGNITQNVHSVVPVHQFVPLANHFRVHVFHIAKLPGSRTESHDATMAEVQIASDKSLAHLLSPMYVL
jgi:hypothetical protein